MLVFTLFAGSCKHEGEKKNADLQSQKIKIVSLTPSITKQLNLLKVYDQVVGHTSHCQSDSLKNSHLVSTGMEVNVEKIATLKPDLILVSSLTRDKIIKNLKKLELNVRYLKMPQSFEEICKQFMQIGSMVDQEKKARHIIQKQKKRLDSLQNLIPNKEKLKFFVEIGANPLFTATKESFMHDYIRYANGKNIAADLKNGMVSRESVLSKNPDVIIIVTMGVVGKEEKKVWQKYPNLNANKNNNIFILNADKASSPTPVSFVDVTEKIINLVYLQKE
jgi:iron complex transport system substrate-binding protein